MNHHYGLNVGTKKAGLSTGYVLHTSAKPTRSICSIFSFLKRTYPGRAKSMRALLYKKSWSFDQRRSAYFSRTYQKPKHKFVVLQEKLILGALNTAITTVYGLPPSSKIFLLSVRHVCQKFFGPQNPSFLSRFHINRRRTTAQKSQALPYSFLAPSA